MVRVLIAEDNAIVAELLKEILSDESDIVVVGVARDGAEAIKMTQRLRPDVVTMDINMPQRNGFEATKDIMVSVPTPIVIVSGVVDRHDVDVSMMALEAGALAVLPKPPSPLSPEFEPARRELISTLRSMADVLVVHRRRTATRIKAKVAPSKRQSVKVVGIGASTGGPSALRDVILSLGQGFPVPVLVVQHIAAGFIEGLVRRLDAATPLDVCVAEHGMALEAGGVYFAPDGKHLTVCNHVVLLEDGTDRDRFVPSVDRLFRCLAREYGAGAIGALLTGMGDDGTEGMSLINKVGGLTIAQDGDTSVVFGMPKAAIEAKVVDYVLPIDEIGSYLSRFARHGSGK